MNDKYIYSGNRQESAPRALFLDQRLTPLERNAWQIIKMMLEADGVTSIPSYEQLQSYLTSMPLAGKASTETVARALIILRLTRWLSLVLKRRNKHGAVLGNVYVLHDEPLSIYECLQLEPDYLSLLSHALSHSSKAIQKVAEYTVSELANDPHLSNKKLPTRLEILTDRLSQLGVVKLSTNHKSEVWKNSLLRNRKSLTSESEASVKACNSSLLRNPKSISSSNKNILLQEIRNNLKLPEEFIRLSLSQQEISLIALNNLNIEQQQQVLEEWQDRCKSQSIKQPAAYLYGIIQNAIRGELNLLKAQSTTIEIEKPTPKVDESESADAKKPVNREQAKAFIQEIKKHLLKLPPSKL